MRKEGYYWIRYIMPFFDGDDENNEWYVAYWGGAFWSLPGELSLFDDDDFEIIDERRIDREEWMNAMDLLIETE